MSNIMLNKVCNLQCPYCFANEFVNNPLELKSINSTNNISLEDFKEAVEFFVRSGSNRIGIIGGEPTMHPNFEEIMEYVINHSKVDNITLFTNGITLKNHMRILNSTKVGVLINANSPKDIGEKKYAMLVESLDTLKHNFLLDRVSLGINMYKIDFDFNYIIELLKKYGMKKIRTAIAVPNDLEKRDMNALDFFRTIKPRVFEFFRELEKICVMPTYDCNNMPVCISTPEEKKWLMTFWDMEKDSGGRCNITDGPVCDPVIDVLPDLTIVRCFGMSEDLKLNLRDFKDAGEISRRFTHELDSLAYYIPTAEECVECPHRISRECMGGCLAFKSKMMKKVTLEINQRFKTLVQL